MTGESNQSSAVWVARGRTIINALVRRRGSEGRWIYLFWLAGYVAVAFVAVTYTAVLGQDYLPAFVMHLVPALIAYVQFRHPTVLGWAALAIPTFAWATIGILLFLGSVLVGDFRFEAVILVLWLGTAVWGFIRYRPFGRGRARTDLPRHKAA